MVNDHYVKVLVLLLPVNARSIVNVQKRVELEAYVIDKSIDIIAITETWSTADISDSEFYIQGFMLFRKYRSGKTT